MQNTNAYEEGFTPAWQAFRNLWSDRTAVTEAPVLDFLKRDTTIFLYTVGVRAGPEGAEAFKRDLKTIEVHLLDTGHFALDEAGETIANYIRQFLPAHLS